MDALPMLITSVLAGLMTTMSVYADKCSDANLSLNDVYMSVLMTAWMFFFMGVLYWNWIYVLIGILVGLASYTAIRTQFLIDEKQFLRSMIPHHSAAVFQSKALQKKSNAIDELLRGIVMSQEAEIEYMKSKLT